MVFDNNHPKYPNTLSLQQALELSNLYLENAHKTSDQEIALVLCHGAFAALSQAERPNKEHAGDPKEHASDPKEPKCQTHREGVAAAYIDLGKLVEREGYADEAQTIYKKTEIWG
ncbi:hypothetical protein B0O80DRAFT_420939 [Mortierella sp. GBAus27b]|nr:hypothetical protein B0O80DRAFT_420939 [Mortierella sp. GBAus27b]